MTEALVLLTAVALTAATCYRIGLRRARPKVTLFEPFLLYHRDTLIAAVVVTEVTRGDFLGPGRVTFSGHDYESLMRENTRPSQRRV